MRDRRREPGLESLKKIAFWILLGSTACAKGPGAEVGQPAPEDRPENGNGTQVAPVPEDPYLGERHRMVERQIAGRGVRDARVLRAMR